MDEIRIGFVTSQWAENNHLYVAYSASLKSTNALAKEEAFSEKTAEEPLCLYLADHQTAGRGGHRTTEDRVCDDARESLRGSGLCAEPARRG